MESVEHIGCRLELFLDWHHIESLAGTARLQMHHPVMQEIAVEHDQPWEGTGSGYHSIFQDGDIYRMYYKSHQHPAGPKPRKSGFTAYAESRDGRHWIKPELGIVEFEGTTKNNIVLSDDLFAGMTISATHPSVFLDTNPACPEEARIKALVRGTPKGLYLLQSADGIHFRPVQQQPVITDGAFDSQNLAFWDTIRQEYRAYYRDFREGIRDIKTARSGDCIHWTAGQWLDYYDAPQEHLYVNQINPYYRAPHILVGFPARYCDRGWCPAMEQLPQLELRRERAAHNPRYGTALTDCLLMSSRDGRHFHRWPKAFLQPGLREEGNWVYGDNYVACHLVETESPLPGAPSELSLYATENYWRLPGTRLRRYTLRKDGFVSVQCDQMGGELVTKPFIFSGSTLRLNASTSAAGLIQVEIQTPDGTPVPGYALDECIPLFGDFLHRRVVWQRGSELDGLAGHPVRLRFALCDADVYAFQFHC